MIIKMSKIKWKRATSYAVIGELVLVFDKNGNFKIPNNTVEAKDGKLGYSLFIIEVGDILIHHNKNEKETNIFEIEEFYKNNLDNEEYVELKQLSKFKSKDYNFPEDINKFSNETGLSKSMVYFLIHYKGGKNVYTGNESRI